MTQAAAAGLAGDPVFVCGGGRPTPNTATVTIYRYVCPYCDGKGRWATDGETCLSCAGFGLCNEAPGFSEHQLKRAPKPPAVMARPCTDCAYRPGSPEEDSASLPGPAAPFFCHHGMFRVGDGYAATAMTDNGLPLGAMVCAGWWALATGEPLPERAFRDPGGSDRRADAPATESEV